MYEERILAIHSNIFWATKIRSGLLSFGSQGPSLAPKPLFLSLTTAYHFPDHVQEFLLGAGYTLGAALDADDVGRFSIGWDTHLHTSLILDASH